MRKWLLMLVVLSGVALAGCWLLPRTQINAANFAKLQVGMTRAEVEAILGGSPRDESTGELVPVFSPDDDAAKKKTKSRVFFFARYVADIGSGPRKVCWVSDQAFIDGDFGRDGMLSWKELTLVERADGYSPLAFFRRLLRR